MSFTKFLAINSSNIFLPQSLSSVFLGFQRHKCKIFRYFPADSQSSLLFYFNLSSSTFFSLDNFWVYLQVRCHLHSSLEFIQQTCHFRYFIFQSLNVHFFCHFYFLPKIPNISLISSVFFSYVMEDSCYSCFKMLPDSSEIWIISECIYRLFNWELFTFSWVLYKQFGVVLWIFLMLCCGNSVLFNLLEKVDVYINSVLTFVFRCSNLSSICKGFFVLI